MYIPLHSEADQKYFFRFKFKKFAMSTVLLPLAGFTICVFMSIWKDFEAANYTHCHVFNILPSVSAAIGAFFPQNFIWKCTIGIHTVPRYIIAFLYYRYNKFIISEAYHFVLFLACILNVVEVTALFGLSFWSSSDNYPVHKACFITFIITSELYMIMMYYLLKKHRLIKPTDVEQYSLRLKLYLLTINISSILMASYFFARHNSHCEPLIYSLFAGFEYIVILTNMAYHMTSCYEIGGREVYVRADGIAVR